jgi:hypothetical protein
MPADSRSKNGVASLAYVAGIHVLSFSKRKAWMAGTSPAMTILHDCLPGTFPAALRSNPSVPANFGSIFMITIAHIQPIVALIAGILILIIPRLLNIIVAIYLIVVGITGLGLIR